jgi:hypothetical protein
VNQTEVAEIVAELRRKHPGLPDELGELERTLGIVPEGAVWRVGDLTVAVFALAPGDALFTITLEPAPEPGAVGGVTLSSRTVKSEEVLARLQWGDYLRIPGEDRWRRTHWTFRYPDQSDDQLEEWQRVSGNVRTSSQPEALDRDEAYARELLARVRRHPVGVGSAEPTEQSRPAQGWAGPDAPPRQQVTDVWGNPLEKRRRKRR